MFATKLSSILRHRVTTRFVVLLPLLLTVLAACNPGNGGGGPAY